MKAYGLMTRVFGTFLPLVFVAMSLPSFASNVRVIGTGGDPSLMFALSLFGSLPLRIEFCSMVANPCELSGLDHSSVKWLQDEILGHRFPKELSFDGSSGVALVDKSMRRIQRPTGDLEKFGFAQSVFLAISEYYSSDGVDLESLFEPLFNSQWELTKQGLSGNLDLLAIEREGRARVILVDGTKFTKDITPILLQSIECASTPKILKAKALESSSGGVILELSWICQGDGVRAKAWIGYDEAHELKVRLFGQDASFLSEDPPRVTCAEWLSI